jgi:putative ABC transport system permease protein
VTVRPGPHRPQFAVRPHLWLIALVGVIVPRRLRADWRQEWERELQYREWLLADWDRLDWRHKLDLLRRSASAFWDALSLQPRRLEDDVMQDLRYGIRMLFAQPGFTAVAVLTLALGIGANTAIFSVVNALLLRPLGGVTDPDRLVQIGRKYPDKTYLSDSSYPDYLDYRAQNTVVSGLALLTPTAFHLSTGQEAERVEGEFVSGNYFEVLGVQAAQGRLIAAFDEQGSDANPVAVISYRLWQRRFGGDPGAVGRTIQLDSHDFTVVGVASEEFDGSKVGAIHDVWAPLPALRQLEPRAASRFDERRASWLELFGRLKPGVTVEQARADFSTIAGRLRQTFPDAYGTAGVSVEPGFGRDIETRGNVQRFAYVPFAAVGIVLLIACANVAGLLLARAARRSKEIGIRLALGAGRIRVVRQLLTESLALALAGGAAGLVVGIVLTRALRSLLPERILWLSFALDFGVDWRVFGFTLAVAALTGVLFGLVPALQVSRPDAIAALKGGGRRSWTGIATMRTCGTLVVCQVSLSLVLLITAGLCVKTLRHARAIDTGYEIEHVLTARIDLGKQRYSEAQGRAFQRQLLDRIEALPGVQAAGFAVTLPLNDGRWESSVFPERGAERRVQTFFNFISPRYLAALNIPMLAGRPFGDRDRESAPDVAIVNETLARRIWGHENPLEKRLMWRMGRDGTRTATVVGVARDIRGRNLFEAAAPMLYLPMLQTYQPSAVLHIRSSVGHGPLVAGLRDEVHALDRNLPVHSIKPLAEHVTATLTPQRLLAHITTGFGLLALLLAGVGLYGLLAYTVAQRAPEIGIRMALGAQPGAVMRGVVAQGMKVATLGVGLGLAAAFAATRLLKGLLFGVSALDPLTFASGALLLLVVALFACYFPARRSASVDPLMAIRCE